MKERQIKKCQNCQTEFTIEPEDFDFYEKIKVPAPTFCPDCRLIRRLAFRNEWYLYKRKDDLTDKEIVSLYPSDSPFPVYNYKDWRAQERWNPMDYARDYDWSRPFLEQFKELTNKVPRYNVFSEMSVGCEYCGLSYNAKNCYLSIAAACEDCAYISGYQSKNCFDAMLWKSENCYEVIDGDNSYNLIFSQDSDNCLDSAFLFDCHNCQNCFFCVGLRNKKYHIFNKSYTAKEYKEKIKEYDLGSFQNLLKLQKEFQEFKLKFPHRFARIFKSVNCTGDDIGNSKNCHCCFRTRYGVEDSKYIYGGGLNLKETYDSFDAGQDGQLMYEGHGVNGYQVFFSRHIIEGRNVYYSDECFNCHDIFGCAGLKNKSYCILNKQYTKEEYERMLPKVIQHMNDAPYVDKKGRIYRFGEFFPMELSPFSYNESDAQDFFPLTKKEAEEKGYQWRDIAKYQNEHKPTIKAADLPDNIKEVGESIINEVIECQSKNQCFGNGVFRIIPMEFNFLKKYSIALPRKCPDCRRRDRMQKRNPLKLWHRKCQNRGCPNEFETPYSPERKEMVYCEKCYQKEVI